MKYQGNKHHITGVKSRSRLEFDPSSSDHDQEIIISDQTMQPLMCPKPRRLTTLPFLMPLGCSLHSQQAGEDRIGMLNRFVNKREVEGCDGCCLAPACYAGSPPRRTGNPLVHDVQFVNQMELGLSPFARTKLNF